MLSNVPLKQNPVEDITTEKTSYNSSDNSSYNSSDDSGEKIVATNSIFISHEYNNSKDISGKVSFTDILETIPKDAQKTPLDSWEKLRKTEWRWRFLKFSDTKYTVEISCKRATDKRTYFNKHGEWVTRDVHPDYDQFVDKIFYYYSD